MYDDGKILKYFVHLLNYYVKSMNTSFIVLRDYLLSKETLSDVLLKILFEKFEEVSFKRRDLLVEKGEVCTKLYFLVNGIVRNYYIDINGNEYTRLITYQNKFFTNFLSFQQQTPSRETIECLEDSTLLAISKSDLNDLLALDIKLFKIFTSEVIAYHNFHLQKLEFLSLLTPVEKLEYLWKYEKTLVNKISNIVLASYMGIKPETCSRIKKEFFR